MSVDLTAIDSSIRTAFDRNRITRAGFVPKSNSGFGARFFNLDFAGKCDDPVWSVQEGMLPEYGVPGRYRAASNAKYRDHTDAHLSVGYMVPCRRCGPCLRYRSWLWASRAEREISNGFMRGCRTWRGTLTLSPENHFEALLRAERKKGHCLDEVPHEERFAARHDAVSVQLTLALKRQRKRMHDADKKLGRPLRNFRYCLVCEEHKSGLPHYHVLVTEVGGPILKSELNGFWPLGFSQWRLCDPAKVRNAARYAAKYLSKSAVARVRASRDYGGERSRNLPGWSASAHRLSAREWNGERGSRGTRTAHTDEHATEGGSTLRSNEPVGNDN